MTGARFAGRDPATVARDLAILRSELREGIETAQAVWHELDRIARSEQASPFTRRRANAAAVALGSLLEDLAADDEEEGPNDPEPEAEPEGPTESPFPWDLWDSIS